MIPAELLRAKRDGRELAEEEIAFLVRGVVSGSVSEAQAAAFLMASCIRGLSARETAALTLAMAHSGATFSFSGIGKPVVDKHSTGGVGDKISLLLVPLAACCGLAVPMISGRGLGHTGGTVDKLESIAGLQLDFTSTEFAALLQRNGAFMAKQTDAIAPADRILYHLRDVTGTVESVGLITASILSKKFAEGLDALVMDMKVGRGAFMATREQAEELAQSMKSVAAEAGLPLRIVFTAMEQPLGNAVGNWVEVQETLSALAGDAPSDIRTVTEELVVAMILVAGKARTRDEALHTVRAAWQSGEALRKFERIIEAQGGDIAQSQHRYANVPRMALRASATGVIAGIHARHIGLAGIALGAGRVRSGDTIDYSAGIVFHKKVGDAVREGEEIGFLQGERAHTFDAVQHAVQQAITIGEQPPDHRALVLGIA